MIIEQSYIMMYRKRTKLWRMINVKILLANVRVVNSSTRTKFKQIFLFHAINLFITCFTKYSNNLLSYPVRYCSCFRTNSGLLVHRYRTARAPISAKSRSIKMAEHPIKPQALNTLTSFYKNKAPKAVKDWVCKQIIWLYYGTSELKDGNKFSTSLWWKTGRRKNNCRSNLERRKISLQLGNSNCNQHALSKLSHQLYQLKCQHFRVVVAILDVISWRHPYYVSLIR